MFNPFTATILLENDCESAKFELLKPLFFSFVKDFHQNVLYKSEKFELLTPLFSRFVKDFHQTVQYEKYMLYAGPEAMFSGVCMHFLAQKFYRLGSEGQL